MEELIPVNIKEEKDCIKFYTYDKIFAIMGIGLKPKFTEFFKDKEINLGTFDTFIWETSRLKRQK